MYATTRTAARRDRDNTVKVVCRRAVPSQDDHMAARDAP